MRAGPGRGALLGGVVGALLTVVLVLLPAALRGDFYEITDPLVFLGVPFVVFGAGLGALLGLLRRRPAGAGGVGPDGLAGRRPAVPATWFVVVAAVLAMMLALWFLLWATGFVAVSPFGLG